MHACGRIWTSDTREISLSFRDSKEEFWFCEISFQLLNYCSNSFRRIFEKKNLPFFIEIDFKSLILCLAIRILSTRNRLLFRFSNASRLIKERLARFLFVRRIRLQFLNCPAFELSKIYGQGNGLSVSRPEITQYLTSWETRLPGKLSLFNVSFSPWCWKNMNFRFVGFNIPFLPFFFLQTRGKLSRFYYLSNKNIHDTRFAGEPKTEWRKQNLNDVEFTHKNERYNLWYLFDTRWADIANWMQFYENCQNIGKFCVIVTVYCIGVECWKKKDRISQFLWKRNKGEWCFVCQEEADRIFVRACNIV